MKTIGIIGAGPAGIMAALKASGKNTRVVLFDSNPSVGRKLLVTGSGRCNITNLNAVPSRYFCADADFIQTVIQRVSPHTLIRELKSLGIPTYSTPDGWCYPISESAANVVDLFNAALKIAHVQQQLNTKIKTIRKIDDGYEVSDNRGGTFPCDQLVVACGGKAYPALGSDGALFAELKQLGLSVNPLLPALAPLTVPQNPLKELEGVRLDVGARLIKDSRVLGETKGNLIVTAWGFNGPAVMDLSYLVSLNRGANLSLELDLLADRQGQYDELLKSKHHSELPVQIFLGALLPRKVPQVILKLAAISPETPLSKIAIDKLTGLKEQLCSICIPIRGTRGFEYAQVKVGGIPLSEVNALTMQSRSIPGLFFAGEVLDVVGPCGGYNLHFAFASGLIAGKSLRE